MQSLFTSEAVSRGHPDKVCDQISDAILDQALAQDPNARVAVESMVKNQQVVLAGELTLADDAAALEVDRITRQVIQDIGYTPEMDLGFDSSRCEILQLIDEQSPDIRQGVDRGAKPDAESQGAGDQGIIFGYACNETETLMPTPIHYAHALMRRHEAVRAMDEEMARALCPDAKSQVTVTYDAQGRPGRISAIVLSTQHSEALDLESVQQLVREQIVDEVVPESMRVDSDFRLYINPTGRFVIGGPKGDCGLTGRKIIVDTYGGMARHGGGAFSGKDPSKVDRSAAYAARYVARHVVACGWAERCELQLAYAIGEPEPVSIRADTWGTGRGEEKDLIAAVRRVFDLSAGGITQMLGLIDEQRRPRYEVTARHGHFGDSRFPWEQLDRLDELRHELGLA